MYNGRANKGSDMTVTQEIIEKVKSGDYRITAYSLDYLKSVYTLEKYYPDRQEWIRIAANTRCVKAAAKNFQGLYNKNLGVMIYKA